MSGDIAGLTVVWYVTIVARCCGEVDPADLRDHPGAWSSHDFDDKRNHVFFPHDNYYITVVRYDVHDACD